MGPVSGRPIVSFSVHPWVNISSRRTRPIRTYFGMRHHGIKALSGCAAHLNPPSSRGFGIINSRAECTETKMGAFEVFWMLNFARHGDLSPVRRAQGASLYFGNGHRKLGHNGHLSVCAPFLDPPFQRGWGHMSRKSGISLKKLAGKYRANALKLIWGF